MPVNRPGRGGQGESPAPQGQAPTQQQAPNGASAPNTGAASPAGAVGGVQAPPPASPSPAAQLDQASPQNAAGATPNQAALRFDPPSITTKNGGTFTVGVTINGGTDIASVPLQITYDPKHLSVAKIDNGDFLTKDGQPVALVHRDDTNTGTLVASAARSPGTGGVSGQGTVFTVTFTAKQAGDTVLSITRPGARNSQQQAVPVLGSQMTISVQQ
jgi:general secretion pathway protein D